MEISDSIRLGQHQSTNSKKDCASIHKSAPDKTVHILCVNDFHATLQESNRGVGCSKLVAAIKAFKVTNPDTIVVFGGDNYFTNPISEHFCGEPVTKVMRELQTVASVVGNHEFYYPADQLKKWQSEGNFVFLAANVLSVETNMQANFARPYWIGEKNGVKIALIGLTTNETIDQDDFAPGMEAFRISDGTESAKAWIQFLLDGKDPLGVPDVILALTHYGLRVLPDGTWFGPELIDLCHSADGLSGAFSAHWHQFIKTTIHNIPVASGGSAGRGFSVLSIRLSKDNHVLEVTPDSVNLMSDRLGLPEDIPTKKMLQDFYRRSESEMNRVIGYAAEEIIHRNPVSDAINPEGTVLSSLVTQTMMETGKYAAAMFYSGRIGSGFRKGPITWYDFCSTVFFANHLVTMKLSGADLMRNIEAGLTTLKGEGASPIALAGVLITADFSRPYGQRLLQAVFSDQTAIHLERFYDIIIDGFLAGSPFGYDFAGAKERVSLDKTLRELLYEKILRINTIPAFLPGNIRLVTQGKEG